MNNEKLSLNQDLMLSFQGYNGNVYMVYDGGELCIAVDNYDKNNKTIHIVHDSELYLPIKLLFMELKHADDMRNVDSNKFEWVSEGYGMPEFQNRLTIKAYKGIFEINFIKNKYNSVDGKNICSIHFSQVDSKNPKVAKAFNKLFLNLYKQKLQNNERGNSLLK